MLFRLYVAFQLGEGCVHSWLGFSFLSFWLGLKKLNGMELSQKTASFLIISEYCNFNGLVKIFNGLIFAYLY